jgi:hypothetical protein
MVFSKKFFWKGELYISQAYWQHQVRQIPTLYESVANVCSKWIVNSLFLYFLGSFYMQPRGLNCPRIERQATKKEVCLPIEPWIFTSSF